MGDYEDSGPEFDQDPEPPSESGNPADSSPGDEGITILFPLERNVEADPELAAALMNFIEALLGHRQATVGAPKLHVVIKVQIHGEPGDTDEFDFDYTFQREQ